MLSKGRNVIIGDGTVVIEVKKNAIKGDLNKIK
jgi:hypothetical protein